MDAGATPDVIRTTDAVETRRAGEMLGTVASPGDVVALTGELGAGKTVFAQGIASGLGVVGRVPSPTFNILLVHRAPVTMYHFDLYRLEEARQLADVDFYGTLEAGGLTVVEWADRFPAELPTDRLDVTIEIPDEGHRVLRVSGTGPRSAELARGWLDMWRSEAEGGRP
jgi:tRNA threonylcarbamoyladenosine biosynthesis protein TsaE